LWGLVVLGGGGGGGGGLTERHGVAGYNWDLKAHERADAAGVLTVTEENFEQLVSARALFQTGSNRIPCHVPHMCRGTSRVTHDT